MKKLLSMAAAAACLSLVGVAEAKAAGPLYLYFQDYCDCMTLTKSNLGGHKWYVGTWDWECTGSSSTLIHGAADAEAILGTQPIDSVGNPAGFSVTVHLESAAPGSDHADITASYDGVTNVLVGQMKDYFLRTGPPCPTTPNPSGKPRMFP